jgi:hypothetical protein
MCFWAKSPMLCIFGKVTLAIIEKKMLFLFLGVFYHKISDLLIKKLPNSTSGSNKVANNIQR